MSPRRILALVALALLAGGLTWAVTWRLSTPALTLNASEAAARKAVRVAPARLEEIRDTALVSGILKGGSEARLAAQVAAPILTVQVRAGERVRRRQRLVQLDSTTLQRQLAQAQAAVDGAGSGLARARTGARLKSTELAHQVKQAESGLAQAQLALEKAETGARASLAAARSEVERAAAAWDAARAQLQRLHEGARPEQIRAAQSGVRQAQIALEAARKNYTDSQLLHDRGALSGAQLEEARRQLDIAQADDDRAQAELELAQAAATPAEIAAAEAQAREAEAGLNAARSAEEAHIEGTAQEVATAREQVRQAEDTLAMARAARDQRLLADEDVRAAQAQLDQAEVQLRLTRDQLAHTTIASPVDGICTEVHAHAGETAVPGMPLVTVVSSAGVHLEAAVPARRLDQLHPGQPAQIQVDSLPGRVFEGQVRSISRAAGPDGRSFPVLIDVLTHAPGLTPGVFARATVVTQRSPSAVVVPTDALRIIEDRTVVWVVVGQRVAERPVEVGIRDERRAQIRSGVQPGERVIVSGAVGLRAGDPVTIAHDR
ncbi:MAG: efflux RND transporter periplasmic adaptor subunit [Armatimonadetes bacterium]|nr:efflux RND transporter periplasmic adaptor subunit [Armatimonadota bacterium]